MELINKISDGSTDTSTDTSTNRPTELNNH